jgi:hypothetical protein
MPRLPLNVLLDKSASDLIHDSSGASADAITFTGNSSLSIDCRAYPSRAIGTAAGKLVE